MTSNQPYKPMTHLIPIIGLRHHDFKDRLYELYALAPGRRMSISIEHDNPKEPDAVTAYLGKHFAGYVRSGANRALACALIRASGRDSLLGKVVGVDPEKRCIWLEVAGSCPEPKAENRPSILKGWHFDGELLPIDEEEQALLTMLSNLEMTTEAQEPWDEDMEQWLEYIDQNLWRDISFEASSQVEHIMALLTSSTASHPEYGKKADRLQLLIDRMGSPETRRLQIAHIMLKAASKDMDWLLLRYGGKAQETIAQLPPMLPGLFRTDGERLIGRLWYLHCPRKQIRALKTLLAMTARIEGDKGQQPSRDHSSPKYQTMTEEQKLQWLQALMQGGQVNINQINLGNGTQNIYQGSAPAPQPSSNTDVRVREAIAALYEATVEGDDGVIHPLFTDQKQWYAVFRVLQEHCGYPSKMSDFVRLVQDRGYSLQQPPCSYESIKKAPQDCSLLSCRTDFWQQYSHRSGSYRKQCRVAEFLLQRLEEEEE